jgi:hypothetical protein
MAHVLPTVSRDTVPGSEGGCTRRLGIEGHLATISPGCSSRRFTVMATARFDFFAACDTE